MSWSHKPAPATPLTGDALARVMIQRARADAYAALLAPGSVIIEDTDGAEIATFRHLLPGALARRGLHVELIVGGWRVVTTALEAPRRPVHCCVCGGSWFRCEHGVGQTVGVRW